MEEGFLNQDIYSLWDSGLEKKFYNALQKAGFEYIGEILLLKREELLGIECIGPKCVDDIESILEMYRYLCGNEGLKLYE